MLFSLSLTETAGAQLDHLSRTDGKKHKKVLKTLGLLEKNPRSTGLKTHKYSSLFGPNGEQVFEAYVENNTPAAYRVFFYYGPGKGKITITAITPHP